MRKNRNFLFAFFIGSLFIYTTAFNSYAITIDGNNGRNEWAGSRDFCIIDNGDQSNCDIKYAMIRTVIDDTDNRLYLVLDCKTMEGAADDNLLGVELFVNDGERIAAFYDSASNAFDPYYYSLDSAFKFDASTNFICGEICIGIKFGIPETLKLGVRIFDCGGVPSNYYTVTILSDGGGQNNDDDDDEEQTSSSTTKASTTKQTTQKAATTKNTPTTAKKTTAPFTTVAYKPVELFKTTVAATSKRASSASTKAEKKDKTTTQGLLSDKSAGIETLTAYNNTELDDGQNNYSMSAMEEIADAGTPANKEETALVNEELDTYRETSRKKTIGIAAASALLSAAVIDVVITGGFKKTKKAEIVPKEKETE